MTALVDTNVLSELPRPRPNANVLRWLEGQGGLMLSVVTIEELAFGVARTRPAMRRRLGRWLEELIAAADHTFDVTPAIARASGELRAAREGAGRRVAHADMLIAATALVHGLPLATRNTRDFQGCGIVLVNPFGDS